MTAGMWVSLIVTMSFLAVAAVAMPWHPRQSRKVRSVAPVPPLPGLELVPVSLALLQAWTRRPDGVTVDEWADALAEVARVMPAVAVQLDRLEELRAQTTRAAAGVRAAQAARAGDPLPAGEVPTQASWTGAGHVAHAWRMVEQMGGVERCDGCGELRG